MTVDGGAPCSLQQHQGVVSDLEDQHLMAGSHDEASDSLSFVEEVVHDTPPVIDSLGDDEIFTDDNGLRDSVTLRDQVRCRLYDSYLTHLMRLVVNSG